jgi:hypothetical protein
MIKALYILNQRNGYVGIFRNKIMAFKIDDVADIAKLIGALKLMVSGEFKISKDVLKDVVVRLHRFAKENGVAIKIIDPSGERVIEITAAGIAMGSIIGLYSAGIPGALVGAVIGGIAGFAIAHITLTMSSIDGDDHVIVHTA